MCIKEGTGLANSFVLIGIAIVSTLILFLKQVHLYKTGFWKAPLLAVEG